MGPRYSDGTLSGSQERRAQITLRGCPLLALKRHQRRHTMNRKSETVFLMLVPETSEADIKNKKL